MGVYINDYKTTISSINAVGKYTHKFNDYIRGDDTYVNMVMYSESKLNPKDTKPIQVTIQNVQYDKLSITIKNCSDKLLSTKMHISDNSINIQHLLLITINNFNQQKESIKQLYSKYITTDEFSNIVKKPLTLTDMFPDIYSLTVLT